MDAPSWSNIGVSSCMSNSVYIQYSLSQLICEQTCNTPEFEASRVQRQAVDAHLRAIIHFYNTSDSTTPRLLFRTSSEPENKLPNAKEHVNEVGRNRERGPELEKKGKAHDSDEVTTARPPTSLSKRKQSLDPFDTSAAFFFFRLLGCCCLLVLGT